MSNIEEDDEVHVVPESDVFEHELTPYCPCQPEKGADKGSDAQVDAVVLVHKRIADILN